MSMVLFHVLESQLGQRLTRCVCRRESASPRVFSWLPPQLFLAPAKRTLLMKRVAAGYHTCHARTIWKEKAPYSQNFEVSQEGTHARPYLHPKWIVTNNTSCTIVYYTYFSDFHEIQVSPGVRCSLSRSLASTRKIILYGVVSSPPEAALRVAISPR
jgi:hypothetical protein